MTSPPDPASGRADRLQQLLVEYRSAWGGQSAEGLGDMPSRWSEISALEPEADDIAAQADYYELLGYDALISGRDGWAFVCFEAAANHAEQAGDRKRRLDIQRFAADVLQHSFPPYESDEEMLHDVRLWARDRLLELRRMPQAEASDQPESVAPGSVMNATMARKHKWMFRQLQHRRQGRTFRIDDLFTRFGLSNEDRVLLRTLAAIHWDWTFDHLRGEAGPMTTGLLVDMVTDEPTQRARWLDRFDARAPLLSWGLVHLADGPSLRHRPVQIDEAVLAWLDGRDHWPTELVEVAELHPPDDRPVYPYQDRALQRLRRALANEDQPRVALRSRSTLATRNLVLTLSAADRRQVIRLVASDLSPALVRTLAREAQIRRAIVLVEAPDPGVATHLSRRLRAPLVMHTDLEHASALRRGIRHLVEVELPPPPPPRRAVLWNEALIAYDLAELSPRDLDVHVGEFDLDVVEMAQVVGQALHTARVTHPGDRVQVTSEQLREAAKRWV